jgi:ubiquinone/menaquinone biosynthesis C-methylase UbiE
MSTSPKPSAKDAIAYHRELASGWEQRYAKPAFQARLRTFQQSLAGHDLRGKQWLDAGCGSGTLARYLADSGANVLGIDAAEEMIALARKLAGDKNYGSQLRFEHISTIADLPLPDNSVDGILCSSVLEYVADPAACLNEFARVLRPKGLLVISVANRRSVVRKAQVAAHSLGAFFGQNWFAFLDHSHNDFSASDFRALLKENRFVTCNVTPFGSPIPQWLQRREFGGSLLAFCAVRE